MNQSETVAVVDCGSNTTRLLIASPASTNTASTNAPNANTPSTATPSELLRVERITGLGRGLHSTQARSGGGAPQLQPDAIERVLAALAEFADQIAKHEVTKVRAVATSAAREAGNSSQFLAAASGQLGHEVELLSEQDEAFYGFLGATSGLAGTNAPPTSASPTSASPTSASPTSPSLANLSLANKAPLLMVDIGGGSTEFVLGRAATNDSAATTTTTTTTSNVSTNPEILGWQSLPLGSVRFTEQYLRSDPPKPEELTAAISVTRQYLEDLDRELPQIRDASQQQASQDQASQQQTCQLVGVAGTITTMAAVELGLAQYDPTKIDNFLLTRAAAEDVFRTLATESLADRRHNPGLASERAPMIVAGCCIAVAIMRHWDFAECRVRHRDLLDGIAAALLTESAN